MRRLVRHGLAGVGAATFAVVAGVTALGAPATTTLAEPANSLAPQSVIAPLVPADPAVEAQRAASAQRENRDAERTRITDAATLAATERANDLGDQGKAITKKSDQIKAARAKAKAEAKARAAAAEKKRKAAIKAQGYEAGVTDPREMAQQILQNKFGYGSDQFSCFDWIIKHESGWNVHATNASSGAYGLPQSLPGSKMASVASDWRDNPATQIIWGAQYMKSRYGSPCGAKSHWESAGNY
ncbi:aggregation-promoting factor C-terminal-like domain-containing protein [Microlunatus flavus]|uniref:Transglycosylase SLT domain-containing protein n=1 Tax=Microlunatus flavus TaxID=1036181 RepID=A0A1H9KAY8_9ACTN|nr:transglycosylase SLT domain-containing protein [Microlunatus flavus]SEQ96097.1 Transglycosylase SLT domain-containing protein [Microlunatus flavus]